MEKNKLKIELLQKILACNDADILKKVESVLDSPASEVGEAGENYSTERYTDPVPDWFYEKLEKDSEKYERGELQTKSWEQVKEEIRRKNGF